MRFEALEERQLLTVAATYVNDNWAFVSDEDLDSQLSVGDIVNDANDGSGSIAGAYGVATFGRVSSGAHTGQLAGSSTIADAIAGTGDGGTTRVSPGNYDGNVAINKPILFSGSFRLNHSYDFSMSHADAILDAGPAPGVIDVFGGNLDLSAGTMVTRIDDSGANTLVDVNGTVDLGNVSLRVLFADLDASVGTEYKIIDNNGVDPVTGTFAGLPQGGTISVGGRTLEIDYAGETGNDVVLTVTAQLNAFQSFVNDNWFDVNGGSLVAGDEVDDRNDTGGAPSVTRIFEDPTDINTIVPTGILSAAYADIQQAVDNTAPGGSVNVLPGSYTAGSGQVVVSNGLILQGGFTLTGSLNVDAATIMVGQEFDTIGVTGLDLSANTELFLKATNTNKDLIDVDGTVDLGGAELELLWGDIDATSDVLLIDNDGVDAVTGTFAGLPEGAVVLLNEQKTWITYQGGDGNDVELVLPDAAVAGRHLFYNDSKFDGNTPGVSASDDAAIDTTKTALLPGQTGSYANISNYSNGINGIMVDIEGSRPNISADDFFFQVGANNAPGSWAEAPAPTTVSVRPGAGVGGADRVEILWANDAIENQWLRINVLSTVDTGLATPDEFYFGSRVGDTGVGNSPTFAITSAVDETEIQSQIFTLTAVDDVWDIDRNGVVLSGDRILARGSFGGTPYIVAPAPPIIEQITGPDVFTPGQDVTLKASVPLRPQLDHLGQDVGLFVPATDVVRVDFYQDVNGNGVLDASDSLMATGQELLDGDGNTAGWSGTFDPGDLNPGSPSLLPVPIDPNGPIGVGVKPTVGGIVFGPIPPTPPPPLMPTFGWSETSGNNLTAFAAANGAAPGPNPFGPIQTNAVGPTLAVAGAAGGWADGARAGSASGFSSNQLTISDNLVEVRAEASRSAGLSTSGFGATIAYSRFGVDGGGALNFTILADAPVGTPVTVMQTLTLVSFANGAPEVQAAASTNVTVNNPPGGTDYALTGPNTTAVVAFSFPARVGEVISIAYATPFANFAGAQVPPHPTAGVQSSVSFNNLRFTSSLPRRGFD